MPRRAQRVKPVQCVSVLWRTAVLLLAATSVCYGTWDLTTPGDPNRNWNVSLASGVQYDDNWNSTEFDKQSGIRYVSDLILQVKEVGQRSLLNGQYDYGLTYPNYNRQGGVNQSHNLNVSETYSFSPRFLVSLNDNFVDALEPQVVQTLDKVPVTIQQAGTYLYNLIGASASYSLTPRWTTSCSGSWDIWRYQEAAYATNNNHEDYSVTLSLLYSLDRRTVVGVNYQYAVSTYSFPGRDDSLNSDGNTGYLSVTHQFNPKLSLALNGGYSLRTSGNGDSSTSPTGYGALIYNYGPQNSVAIVAAESLSTANVGGTGGFSAQENTSFNLQVNHRFTARLHTTIQGSYVYGTYTLPIVGETLVPVTVTPSTQTFAGSIDIGYDFRVWLSARLDYNYYKLTSSFAALTQPYSRDVVGVRLVLTY